MLLGTGVIAVPGLGGSWGKTWSQTVFCWPELRFASVDIEFDGVLEIEKKAAVVDDGMCGELGVIGVKGDVVVVVVVVDELKAGDKDCWWSSEKKFVIKFIGVVPIDGGKSGKGNNGGGGGGGNELLWATVVVVIAAVIDDDDGDDDDVLRFSIAKFLRIIILLVFGNNKLFELENSLFTGKRPLHELLCWFCCCNCCWW